jgi:SpoVK/Ycf46/Vps4 family AAA+-type ATPase
MLALSVVHHAKNSKCLWVSIANITSKFIGESEKHLALLFDLALEYAPSVIVIDEVDCIVRLRRESESESERRLKTEFYKQMDRILGMTDKHVTVFATTNMPWEMDLAALRRFGRRIMVSLPDKETRTKIIKI